jgi:hypothetical protein
MIRLATVAAAHEEVYFGEEGPTAEGPFKVGPLSMYHRGVLDAILQRQARTPIEEAAPRLAALPEPERAEAWEAAKKASAAWQPPQVGGLEGNAYFTSDPRGCWEFFRVLMTARQDLDDATLDRLWRICSPEDFRVLTRIGLEVTDPKAILVMFGPGMTEEDRTRLHELSEALGRLSRHTAPLRWITG